MKIKMLTGLTGPEYSLAPGDERTFPDAEATRLIAAGYAEPATDMRAEVKEGKMSVNDARTASGMETTAKPAARETRAKS